MLCLGIARELKVRRKVASRYMVQGALPAFQASAVPMPVIESRLNFVAQA